MYHVDGGKEKCDFAGGKREGCETEDQIRSEIELNGYDQLLRLHLRLIGEIKVRTNAGSPRTGNGALSMERKSVYVSIKGGLIAPFVDEPCS
jgi:hypothetical protein